MAGHTGDQEAARAAVQDQSPAVRAAALSALARMGALGAHDLVTALADPAAAVRARACDLAARNRVTALVEELGGTLSDPEPSVVEAACYALGELGEPTLAPAIVARLALTATAHPEALCREAAVAALGALGSPDGLVPVLAALADKPAIRRRAVVALASFDGDEVEAALSRAATDVDWQVRQAAEDLLGERPRP